MASNQTSNYKLNQWEPEDQVLRQEFNDDNDKIDKALKALADKDQALEQTLSNQAAAIAKLGNCSIERFTYVGTGDTTASVRFSKPPILFFIIGGYQVMIGSSLSTTASMISYSDLSHTSYVSNATVSWSGATLTANGINSQSQTYQVFSLSAGNT